jgi:hypothetical protein
LFVSAASKNALGSVPDSPKRHSSLASLLPLKFVKKLYYSQQVEGYMYKRTGGRPNRVDAARQGDVREVGRGTDTVISTTFIIILIVINPR